MASEVRAVNSPPLRRETEGTRAATAALESDPGEGVGIACRKIEGRGEDVRVVPVVTPPDVFRDHVLEHDRAVEFVDQCGGSAPSPVGADLEGVLAFDADLDARLHEQAVVASDACAIDRGGDVLKPLGHIGLDQ